MTTSLKDIGAALRAAREKRNLSMQEASEITKISKRILVAFEQADRDQFPHPVYAKGFVKNYARLLGLDAEDLARSMDQELRITERQDGLHPGRTHPVADGDYDNLLPAGERRSSWPVILLILLLLGVLAALVWHLAAQSAGSLPDRGEPPSAPVLSKALEASGEGGEDAASSDGTAQEPAAAEDVAVNRTDARTTVAAGADEVPEGSGLDLDSSVPPQGVNRLQVAALDEEGSWIGVYDAEGEVLLKDYTVRGNGVLDITVDKTRTFRFGRVQGVRVVFNGTPLALDGTGLRTMVLPPPE